MTLHARQASVGLKKILPSIGFLTLLSLFVLPLSQSHATSFTTGLVGHWNMDEGGGADMLDSSGNSNNGTISGAAYSTEYAPTIFENASALSFDGTNDTVAVGSVTGMPTNAFTVCAWMNNTEMSDIGTSRVGVGIGDGTAGRTFWMGVWDTDDQYMVSMGNGTTDLSLNVDKNTGWHHMCATKTSTGLSGYIDGTFVGMDTDATASLISTELTIGNYPTGSFYFKGSIDDVRIYNRALSAEEISVLAAEKSLVGYWKFDETSGTSATDSSGMGNTGTHTNGPTISTDVPDDINFTNGRSLSFDGTNDYVSIPNSAALSPTSEITVSSWVRIDGGSGLFRTIVSKPAGATWTSPYAVYNVRFNTSDKLEAFINDGGNPTNYVTSNTTFAANGSWHHIAFTYDGATQILYVDGVQDASNALVDVIDTSAEPLIIGNSIPGNSEVFNGGIDDFRIYNRALSSAEIGRLAVGHHPNATWTGEHSIYFEDPNNWDTGVVPDPYSKVVIDDVGARPILTNAASLSDLTVNAGASLDLRDKDLTMLDGGTFSNNGTLILDGSQTLTDFTNDSNSGQAIITGQSNSTSFATGNTYYDLRIEDPTENGLVAYWKLDEGSGATLFDAAGSGYDGTLTNGAAWDTATGTTTFFNQRSVSFDATNDYVAVDDAAAFTDSTFSVSAWFKWDGNRYSSGSGRDWMHIISKNNYSDGEFSILVNRDDAVATNEMRFYINGDSAASFTPTLDTGWHHVTVTYDQSLATIYLDGVQGAQEAYTNAVTDTSNNLRIGGGTNASYTWGGNIDDVRFYSRTLSADEASSLAAGNYANGTTSTATHTPTTIPTINGDLALDSGNLNLGSNSLTVTDLLEVNGGTLTKGAGTLTAASYVQQGGVFVGGSGNMDVNIFTLSGGTLTAPSGNLSVGFNTNQANTIFTIAGSATFSNGSGTLVIDPIESNTCNATYQTLDLPGTANFYNVTVNATEGGCGNYGDVKVADNDTLVVNNNLTMTDGAIYGNWSLKNNLSVGSGADGLSALLSFTGDGDQTYSVASGGVAPAIRINKATGTVTPADGTTELTAHNFSLYTGSFTAPTGIMTLNQSTVGGSSADLFTLSGSTTFNHNEGTLKFNPYTGSCGQTLNINVATTATLHSVEAAGSDSCGQNRITYSVPSGDVLILGGSLTVTNENISGAWTVNGDLLIGANADGGDAAFTLSGSTTQVIESEGGTWPSGTFAINKSSGTAALSGALVLNTAGQDLTMSGGTLNLAGFDLTVNDAFIVDTGATLELKGGETVSTPVLNAGSIVQYDGDTVPVTVKDWDYKTLDLSAPGKEFQFTAGGSYVVETEWIVEGTAGNLVTLRSTSDDTQWDIDPQGTRTLAYLDVQDSNNVNATAITTSGLNIDSSGNNTNWIFDVTAPTVSSFTPVDGATNQTRDVTLEIEFSEDVIAVAAKNITLKNLLNDNTIETIAASGALVTVSGSTVTINPSVTIPYSTPVYVLIDNGAFKDEFDNDFAGITSNTTWNFTIVDETYTPSSESSSESTGGGGGGGGGRGIAGPGGRSTQAEAIRQALVDRFKSQVASDEVTVPPEGSASSRSSKPTIVKGSASSSPTQTAQTSSARIVTQDRGHLKVQDGVVAVLYKDVPVDAWFAPYVSLLIEENIAQGYKDETGKPKGEFGVTNPVTYAEVAKMVLEAAGKDLKKAGTPRNATAKGTWASSYIALAESLQMSVYTPSLDVMQPATRGQVIQSILEAFGIPVKAKNIASFTDLPESHPHAQAIGVAYLYGLIDGDTNPDGTPKGTVRPDDQVNRAEVAKIIALALKLL